MIKKLEKLPLIILSLPVLVIVIGIIFLIITYLRGHEIVYDKTVGKEILCKRTNDWHKVQNNKISIDEDTFSHIEGITECLPITAELARQFLDTKDEDLNSVINCSKYDSITDVLSKFMTHTSKTNIILVNEDAVKSVKFDTTKFDITPIAIDGLVYITHKDNKVDSLTKKQIEDIYSGDIKNWKDVGGADKSISLYGRGNVKKVEKYDYVEEYDFKRRLKRVEPMVSLQYETNINPKISGDKSLCKGLNSIIGPKERSKYSNDDRILEEYDNSKASIGYAYDCFIDRLYSDENIKKLKVDGISPEEKNYINKTYPFLRTYYAVTRKGENKKGSELREYLLTDEGQEIIKLAGYCPIRKVE